MKINWSKVWMKYPPFTHKIHNISFLIDNIEYRLGIVQAKYIEWFKDINDNFIKLNVDEPYDIEEILNNKGVNPRADIEPDDEYWNEFHSIPVLYELLFEFNSYLTLLKSFIDNVIDAYISINYHPKENDLHWDLKDFMNNNLINFKQDPQYAYVKSEYNHWLRDVEKNRNLVIHRIPKTQKMAALIYTKGAHKRYLRRIKFDEFEDSIYGYSLNQLELMKNVSNTLLKSLLAHETVSGSWVKYQESLDDQ